MFFSRILVHVEMRKAMAIEICLKLELRGSLVESPHCSQLSLFLSPISSVAVSSAVFYKLYLICITICLIGSSMV